MCLDSFGQISHSVSDMSCDMTNRSNDYLDEDAPDPNESGPPFSESSLPGDLPACHHEPPAASTNPKSTPAASPGAPPLSGLPSQAAWDVSRMMWLADRSRLPTVIAQSDAVMPA
jgi:hypothetical protein